MSGSSLANEISPAGILDGQNTIGDFGGVIPVNHRWVLNWLVCSSTLPLESNTAKFWIHRFIWKNLQGFNTLLSTRIFIVRLCNHSQGRHGLETRQTFKRWVSGLPDYLNKLVTFLITLLVLICVNFAFRFLCFFYSTNKGLA